MKIVKKVLLYSLLIIISMIISFELTLNNLQIKEINTKDNIVLMSIMGQSWVYEK